MGSDPILLNSYAKLNLYLEIINKREDGYHNIRTLFERIGLADKIILQPRRDKKITITCNNPQVPLDASNLAFRSARLLQKEFNVDKGVDIKIIKRIPVGSGMAGGSGNAATTLMGLNRLWKLRLTRDKLARLAGKIGCDVPFFIYDCPFALGERRGDKVKPLKALCGVRLWHIVVVPKIGVSTPSIYKEWDKLPQTFKLTMPRSNVNILILALKKSGFLSIGSVLFNGLEKVTAALYPKVKRVKEKLAIAGLKSTLMSGSGPAVFGIVSSRKEALSLGRQLKKDSHLQVFVVRTL